MSNLEKIPVEILLENLSLLLLGNIPNLSDLLSFGKMNPEKSDQIEKMIALLKNSYVSPRMKFGRDLVFAYGGIGVVVHADTIVGNGVMIGQGVTIGGTPNGMPRKIERLKTLSALPQIGNHCYIGAGARILGPVDVGNFSIIQANCVVLDHVPDFTIVGGIPAKPIKRITKSNCHRYLGMFHSAMRDFVNRDALIDFFPD